MVHDVSGYDRDEAQESLEDRIIPAIGHIGSMSHPIAQARLGYIVRTWRVERALAGKPAPMPVFILSSLGVAIMLSTGDQMRNVAS